MSGRAFLSIFGTGPVDGEPFVDTRRIAVVAAQHGYAVMPVEPFSKIPLCTLSSSAVTKANREARAEGRPRHACGLSHATTDARKVGDIFGRLQKHYNGAPLNLAVRLDASRLISVDMDTAEQVGAFELDHLGATGDRITPNVVTPGQLGPDGTWRHKDGGHVHFTVPEGFSFPEGSSSLTDASGYVVKWGAAYFLVPPSQRHEGPYVARGDVLEAPAWLGQRILEHGRLRELRAHSYTATALAEPIGRWSLSISWAELLLPDGWSDPGIDDSCGCPIFTRPGDDWGNVKSATAHEPGCALWEQLEGHTPLHLWSDNAPQALLDIGRPTITKLEYVAATGYANDIGAAMADLGISVVESTWLEDVEGLVDPEPEEVDLEQHIIEQALAEYDIPVTDGSVGAVRGQAKRAVFRRVGDEVADRLLNRHRDPLAGIRLEGQWWLDVHESARPTVLHHGELGKALLYPGRVNSLVGPKSSGKTWLAVKASLEVLEAGGRVFYADLEDSWPEWRERALELSFDIDSHAAAGTFMHSPLLFGPRSDLLAAVPFLGTFDLVVFDVLSRLIVRMGSERVDVANDEVLWLTDRILEPVARLGSCVLLLDHPNKAGQKATTFDALEAAGGAAKGNVATGAIIGLLPTKPFSRLDPEGSARIGVLKDRLGHVGAMFEEVAQLSSRAGLNELTGGLGLELTLGPPATQSAQDAKAEQGRRSSEHKVYAKLAELGPSTVSRLADYLEGELSQRTIERTLNRLKDAGMVESREGMADGTEGRPPVLWQLTQEGDS